MPASQNEQRFTMAMPSLNMNTVGSVNGKADLYNWNYQDNDGSTWGNLRPILRQQMQKQVKDYGSITVKSGAQSGLDYAWLRAAINLKYELGRNEANRLYKTDAAFRAETDAHRGDNAWFAEKAYEEGSKFVNIEMYSLNRQEDKNALLRDEQGNPQLDDNGNYVYDTREQKMLHNLFKHVDVINQTNEQDLNLNLLNGANDVTLAAPATVFDAESKNAYRRSVEEASTHTASDAIFNTIPLQRLHALDLEQPNNTNENTQGPASESEANTDANVAPAPEVDLRKPSYVLLPNKSSYILKLLDTDKGEVQNRYWWRDSDVAESNPVTFREFQKAIGSMMPVKRNKDALNAALRLISSEHSYIKPGSNEADEYRIDAVLEQRLADGNVQNVSPSDMETMISLVSVLSDAGIDYDVKPDRDGTISLRLNDNSGSSITLLDPSNPNLIGTVRTRDGLYWRPELSRALYRTDNEPATQFSKHAIISTFDSDGNELEPVVKGKVGYKYRNNEIRMSHFNPAAIQSKNSQHPADVELSRTLARRNYASLDQTTKNKLALSPMLSVLGIDKSRLPQDQQAYFTESKIEQISRQSLSYQAQINLGNDADAYMTRVEILDNGDNSGGNELTDNLVRTDLSNDSSVGKIHMDLRGAIVGDDRTDSTKSKPLLNPYETRDNEIHPFIHNAFKDARINYLHQLVGEDQTNMDDVVAAGQKEFKRTLANMTKRPVLNESGTGYHLEPLPPLNVKYQDMVVSHFQKGLLQAQVTEDGVDDSNLLRHRELLADSINDPYDRSRAVEVFDDLTNQMNGKFGTAPIVNQNNDLNHLNDTPAQYRDRYDAEKKYLSSHDSDLEQLDGLNDNLKHILVDANVPVFDGVDDAFVDEVFNTLSYQQQYQLLNDLPESDTKNNAIADFAGNLQNILDNHGLDKNLNAAAVVANTEAGVNSNLYPFRMAQVVAKSRYKNQLSADTDTASQRFQERAIQFDSTKAMTMSQLEAADKAVDSDEYKIRQYLQRVKDGQIQPTLDPNVNPFPQYFNHNGTALLRDMSPNQFKIQMLKEVKKQLEARGAEVSDDDIKIDNQGVIHFDAQVPLVEAATHEHTKRAPRYISFEEASNTENEKESQDIRNGEIVNNDGYAQFAKSKRIMTKSFSDKDGRKSEPSLSYQPLSGNIGQIFAPEHDGMIRTSYNRFENQDPKSGQFVFLPRSRGTFQSPKRDANGDYDLEALAEENRTGLGEMSRLVATSYDQSAIREISQAMNNLISTKAVGDVTRPNSLTIMNKLMHGETYGQRVPETELNKKATPDVQAQRETNLKALKFDDSVADATSINRAIGYVKDVGEAYRLMRANNLLTDPNNLEQSSLEVQRYMHDPMTRVGTHSVGAIATKQNRFYFSDTMTGQGGSFGTLRFMGEGVSVDSTSGRLQPTLFKDANGNPLENDEGEYVGVHTGSPLENTEMFDGHYKNAADRAPVAEEQAMKGFDTPGVGIATMSLGGMTLEDASVISKEFAESHMISDEVNENGEPIYRPLMVGDKISDIGGNKTTINAVIDPEMDSQKAEDRGILDVVQLFHDNPDLGMVVSPTSQISRNNGATGAHYVENESSQPMTYTRMLKDENGNFYKDSTVQQTDASINKGIVIVTDQTVNHKVTLYDNGNPNDGRKMSVLLATSDNTKGAHNVANFFRKHGSDLVKFRNASLALGLDVTPEGLSYVDYSKLAEETTLSHYEITPENESLLTKMSSRQGLQNRDALKPYIQREINTKKTQQPYAILKQMFNDNGSLNNDGISFIAALKKASNEATSIAKNSDVATSDKYDAGQDFLNQLPDGGVLQLPEGVHVSDSSFSETDKLYILPRNMRVNQQSMDNTVIYSNLTNGYQSLGVELAKYHTMVNASKSLGIAEAGSKSPEETKARQKALNEQIASSLGIQAAVDRVHAEADRFAFGGGKPKYSFFKNRILGGTGLDSVTTQLSSDISIPMDVIEISPKIAERLGFVTGEDGMAHMKDHPDWDRVHVHRDPIWREQGSLGFRVKIKDDDNFRSVQVNPVMASMMDADFDGDNVGLVAMDDVVCQQEMKEKMSVDQWMLDNNQADNLLNINAELVDTAHRLNPTYHLTDPSNPASLTDPSQQLAVQLTNPADQKLALELMHKSKHDVVPADWFDADGKFKEEFVKRGDHNEVLDLMPDGKADGLTSGKFMDMMVNNQIHNYYDQGMHTQARQSVDEFVQISRGMEVSRAKNGEVVAKQGEKALMTGDGVNYKDNDSMKTGLLKYVTEGAKGDAGKVEHLMEMTSKLKHSKLLEMGNRQVNEDGTLNREAHFEYSKALKSLNDEQLATQLATKTKTDATGTPGKIQQDITAAMMGAGPQATHAANSIGQAMTQKILSIKRDPVGANRTAELLQAPMGQLLRGQMPVGMYPTYSLVGAESDGRLGNDLVTVGIRAEKLRSYQDEAGLGLEHGTPSLANKDYPKDKLEKIASSIGIKFDKSDAKKYDEQLDKFRETAYEATQPFLNDEFLKSMHDKMVQKAKNNDLQTDEKLKDYRGVNAGKLPSPMYKRKDEYDKNGKQKPVEMSKDEFVEVFDYLANDKLGLGIDRKNFEMLADLTADKDTGKMPSIVDQSTAQGNAPSAAKVMMQGTKGFNAVQELPESEQDNGTESVDSREQYFAQIFGSEDSYIRKSLFGGMKNEDLAEQLSLTKRDDGYQKDTDLADLPDAKQYVGDGVQTNDELPLGTVAISSEMAKLLEYQPGDKMQLKTGAHGDMGVDVVVDDNLAAPQDKLGSLPVAMNVEMNGALDFPDQVMLVSDKNESVQNVLKKSHDKIFDDKDTMFKYQDESKRSLAVKENEFLQDKMLAVHQSQINHDQRALLAGTPVGDEIEQPAPTSMDEVSNQASSADAANYSSPFDVVSNSQQQLDAEVAAVVNSMDDGSSSSNFDDNPFGELPDDGENLDLGNNPDDLNALNELDKGISLSQSNPHANPFDTPSSNSVSESHSEVPQSNAQSNSPFENDPFSQGFNDLESASDLGNSSNVTSTTPKPVETTPASNNSNDKPYDLDEDVVSGNYYSPMQMPDMVASSPNAYLSKQLANDAHREVSLNQNDIDTIDSANRERGHTNEMRKSIGRILTQYNNETGDKLDTPTTLQKWLKKGYVAQMQADSTVNETLHRNVSKLNKFHIKEHQKQAIIDAVQQFDKQQSKSSQTNNNNFNTPQGPNNGPSI